MIGALAIATIAAAVMSDEERTFRERYRDKIFWFSLIEWKDGTVLRRLADQSEDPYRAFRLMDPKRATYLPSYSHMIFSTFEDEEPFVGPSAAHTVESYVFLEKFFPMVQHSGRMGQLKKDRDLKTQPLERPVWVSPLLRRTALEQATGQLPVGLREESALRGHLFDLLPLFMDPAELKGSLE